MFDDSNGQIKLRAKQKFKFLSATHFTSVIFLKIFVFYLILLKKDVKDLKEVQLFLFKHSLLIQINLSFKV